MSEKFETEGTCVLVIVGKRRGVVGDQDLLLEKWMVDGRRCWRDADLVV